MAAAQWLSVAAVAAVAPPSGVVIILISPTEFGPSLTESITRTRQLPPNGLFLYPPCWSTKLWEIVLLCDPKITQPEETESLARMRFRNNLYSCYRQLGVFPSSTIALPKLLKMKLLYLARTPFAWVSYSRGWWRYLLATDDTQCSLPP